MKNILSLILLILSAYGTCLAAPGFSQYQISHSCTIDSAHLQVKDISGSYLGFYTVKVTNPSLGFTDSIQVYSPTFNFATAVFYLPLGVYNISVFDGSSTTTVLNAIKLINTLVYNPSLSINSTPFMQLNLKTDFCAIGDSIADDYEAFVRAAQFINNRRGKCELTIPTGNYNINPKLHPNLWWDTIFNGKILRDAMMLKNVDSVIIHGIQDSTYIFYANGQPFGYFDSAGNKAFPVDPDDSLTNLNTGKARSPGNFISLVNSKDIFIHNITVDGNNIEVDTGKSDRVSSPNSRQIPASGLYLWYSCDTIRVTNCKFNHFCLDGITMVGSEWDFPTYITINRIQCFDNARNGLSIAAGKHMNIRNSDFRRSGKFNPAPPATYPQGYIPFAKFLNTPAAGVDIETDFGLTKTTLIGPDSSVTNIEYIDFDSCRSIDNFGAALTVLARPGSLPDTSIIPATILKWANIPQNITFNYSEFRDYDSNTVDQYNCAVSSEGIHVTYDHCTFTGNFFRGGPSNVQGSPHNPNLNLLSNQLVLSNCLFNDDEDGDFHYKNVPFLFDSPKLQNNMLLDNCTFKVKHPNINFINIMADDPDTVSFFNIIKDCTFEYLVGHNNSGTGVKNSIFRGCIFDGNTKFINSSNDTGKKKIFSSQIVFKGSNASCSPNVFELDKNVNWEHSHVYCCNNASNNNLNLFIDNQKLLIGASNYNAGSMTYDLNGYLNLIIPKDAEFKTSLLGESCTNPSNIYPTIAIGHNAKIDCQMESFLSIAHAKVENQGQLILEANSKANLDTVNYSDIGATNEVLYIDATCTDTATNFNNTSLPNSTCVYGNNAVMNSNTTIVACSQNYTNVAVNDPFTLLYSSTNIICGGANTGSIQALAKGGSGAITYTLNPGNYSNTNGDFSNLSPNIYTITASDGSSCSITKTIEITSPQPLAFNLSTSTSPLCHGGLGQLHFAAIGGTLPISYNVNSTATISPYSAIADNYIITAIDANSCSITTSITITEPTAVAWNSISSQNVNCFGSNSGIISVLASGGTPQIDYNYTSDPLLSNQSGNFYNLPASTYTVTAADANACSITTLITITQPSALTFQTPIFINPISHVGANDGTIKSPCSINSGTPPYSYSINGGSFQQSSTFNNLGAGTYTIVAKDANYCTVSTIVELLSPTNFCPSVLPPQGFLNSSNRKFYDNTAVSALNLGTNQVSNADIFVNGNFVIDQSITFTSCNFYFTANAKITVILQNTLTIDGNSSLQAGCGVMWDGIYASNPNSQIHIENSFLYEMENGIVSNNGAKINLISNNFVNNYIGIKIMNSPSGFNVDNQQCNIRKNKFLSAGSGTLLPPHNSQSKSEFGIFLFNCAEVEIGHIDYSLPDPTDENEFLNIYCGIYSIPAHVKDPQLIQIYNNKFTDIHNDLTGNYIDNQKVNNCYSGTQEGWRGAGICFHVSDQQTTSGNYGYLNNHSAKIKNLYDGGSFINCDKAIVGHAINAEIYDVYAENCLLGFMFTSATNQQYKISDNKLVNPIIGAQFIGDVLGCTYTNNQIDCGSEILKNATSYLFPIGIDIKQVNNLSPSDLRISDNTINMSTICGIGINLQNTGDGLIAHKNNIYFNSTSSGEGLSNYNAVGINLTNCRASQLEQNNILGNPSLMLNPNITKGIQLGISEDCGLTCNSTYLMPLGWTVIGKCKTDELNIKGNHFNSHLIGMLYWHLGNEGTLGNIGDGSNDNRNQFYGNYYINDQTHTSPTQYRDVIYRLSGCGNNGNPNDYIFTTTPTLSSSDLISSCPNVNDALFYRLNINPSQGATNFDCPIDSDEGPDNGPSDHFNLGSAISIAQQTTSYPEFPEVAQWFNERNLFKTLDDNDTLRQSSPLLSNFYFSQQLQSTDEILATQRHLASLIDSTIANDTIQLALKLQEAQSSNNGISTLRSFEENEQVINDLYIRWLTYGENTFTTVEKETIEALALSCPFVYGSAVYFARSLNTNFNPLVDYNDLNICNTAGVYKNSNGAGLFDNENQFVNQLTSIGKNQSNNSISKFVDKGIFKIFPNPASTNITIAYQLTENEHGKLLIFDALGREQLKIELSSSANKVIANVQNLFKGVYTFKYVVNNINQKTGKLIIE